MENIELLLEQINELIQKGEISALRELLTELNVVDIAQIIEEIEQSDRLPVFRVLPKDLSAEVFAYLETDTQAELVRMINDAELERLLDEMFLDDTVDFLEEVPANVVTRVLAHSAPEARKLINRFLKYPEDCAGSIMTIEMVQLHTSFTAAQAIEQIRKTGVDKETVYTCYCTDRERHLLGSIPLLSLLLCDENELVGDIMEDDAQLISVNTLDDREEVADIVKKYDLLSVPVVDNENRLVGIITVDDAIDVLQEENTEDIQKMAAITPTDTPYLKTSVIETWKKRIPWLMILMVSATLTSQILTSFEDRLLHAAVLSAFIPMLTGTSGNAGAQSSSTIIRALSLNEVTIKDIFKVMWKELRVGAVTGLTLAAVNFAKLVLVDRLLFGNEAMTVTVALVICLTVFAEVVCAKIIGSSLPIIAKKMGLDPAVLANPFITTILDVVSLLVYIGFAILILGI